MQLHVSSGNTEYNRILLKKKKAKYIVDNECRLEQKFVKDIYKALLKL